MREFGTMRLPVARDNVAPDGSGGKKVMKKVKELMGKYFIIRRFG